jgi:hypothetical protein
MVTGSVIAKYAPVRFGLGYAFLLALLGLTWVDIFRASVRTEVPWIIVVAVVTLLVLRASATILVQAVRHGGRAIWIESGHLRYPDSSKMTFASVPLGDVQDVSIVPGGFLRPVRIAIRARDNVDYIKAYFFHPSAELIRARLSDALVSVKAARGPL